MVKINLGISGYLVGWYPSGTLQYPYVDRTLPHMSVT